MKPHVSTFTYTFLRKAVLVLTGVVAFQFLFSHYVPIDMDEFSAYHALACWEYPENQKNRFREACDEYDMKLFSGPYLPFRSGGYEGSITGIFYYPLFALWRSPDSARLLNSAMLAVQALILHGVFGVGLIASYAALLAFMPYSFQLLTGLQSILTTSVFLILWLATRWARSLDAQGRSWLWSLLIGLTLFIGTWMRLNYVPLIPALLLSVYFVVFRERRGKCNGISVRIAVRDSIALLVAFLAPAALLFEAQTRHGYRYYEVVTASRMVKKTALEVWIQHLTELLGNLGNPWYAAKSFWQVEANATTTGIVLWATLGAAALCGLVLVRKRPDTFKFFIVHLGLFAGTLLAMAFSQHVRYMHHLVLAFPLLLVALTPVVRDLWRWPAIKILFLLFIATGVLTYSDLSRSATFPPRYPGTHIALKHLNAALNQEFDGRYAFICVDWGIYYLKALYGRPDQMVLYVEPLTRESQVTDIVNTLREAGRKPVILKLAPAYSRANMGLISKAMGGFKRRELGFDTGPWEVWYQE